MEGGSYSVAPVMTGMIMCQSREMTRKKVFTSEALKMMRSKQATDDFNGNGKLFYKYII